MQAYWSARPPASAADIGKLQRSVRFDLPAAYLELVQRTNGGSGPLGLPPLWLELWSVDEVIDFSRFSLYAQRYPGYFFFAANGANENLAMRRAPDGTLEIVAVDITVGPESTQVIARDFEAFARAIGR